MIQNSLRLRASQRWWTNGVIVFQTSVELSFVTGTAADELGWGYRSQQIEREKSKQAIVLQCATFFYCCLFCSSLSSAPCFAVTALLRNLVTVKTGCVVKHKQHVEAWIHCSGIWAGHKYSLRGESFQESTSETKVSTNTPSCHWFLTGSTHQNILERFMPGGYIQCY